MIWITLKTSVLLPIFLQEQLRFLFFWLRKNDVCKKVHNLSRSANFSRRFEKNDSFSFHSFKVTSDWWKLGKFEKIMPLKQKPLLLEHGRLLVNVRSKRGGDSEKNFTYPPWSSRNVSSSIHNVRITKESMKFEMQISAWWLICSLSTTTSQSSSEVFEYQSLYGTI